MGNKIKKGNRCGRDPLRKFQGIQKIAGAVGLSALFVLRLFSADFTDRYALDGRDTALGISFHQGVADISGMSVFYRSEAELGEGRIDWKTRLGYQSLGIFEFTDSEDFAYRNPRNAAGIELNSGLDIGIRFKDWNLVFSGNMVYCHIEETRDETILGGGLDFGILSPAGKINMKVCYQEEEFGLAIHYSYRFYTGKISVDMIAEYYQDNNSVFCVGPSVGNYRKDLFFGVFYRHGVIYPVANCWEIRLAKKAGPFWMDFMFSPSDTANHQFKAGVLILLGSDGDLEENIY